MQEIIDFMPCLATDEYFVLLLFSVLIVDVKLDTCIQDVWHVSFG
jgi:hypothetical protein